MLVSLCALLVVGSARPVFQSDGHSAYVQHFARAWELDRSGEREEAAREYERALAWSPGNSTCAYYLACNEAARGRTSESLAWLERAVDWGWSEAELTAADPSLQALRATPQFEVLLARMRSRDRSPAPKPQIHWSFGIGDPSISPDGARAGSVGEQFGHLWDVPSGELVSVLQSDGKLESVPRVFPDGSSSYRSYSSDGVESVRFTPDGSLVVANFSNDVARVFEAETGELRHHFEFDGWRFLFAERSENVIAASVPTNPPSSAIEIRDLGSGEVLCTLSANVIALSPDGTRALTDDGMRRDKAVLWNVDTGDRIAEFANVLGADIDRACFSADGRRAAVFGVDQDESRLTGFRYRLIDVVGGELLSEIDHCLGYADGVRFLPNDTLLLPAGTGSVQSLDPATGDVAWTLNTGIEAMGSFGVSPSGAVLVTQGWREGVDAWSNVTSRRIWQRSGATAVLPFGSGNPFCARSPESIVIATNTAVEQVDVHTGETIARLRRQSRTPHFAEHPTLGTILVGIGSGDLRALDIARAETSPATSNVLADPLRVVYSPNGDRWAIATADGRVWIGADEASAPTASFEAFTLPMELAEIAFSPDGTRLLAWGRDLWGYTPPQVDARLWHVDERRLIARITPSDGHCMHAAWDATGDLIATSSSTGAVELWSGRDGTPMTRSFQHPPKAEWVAFHPSAPLLASAGDDAFARVWDMTTGECLHAFRHSDMFGDRRVRRVAFLDDEPRLLTTSGNYHQVWCWDLETDEQAWTFEGSGGNPWPVEFLATADESRLFVSGQHWTTAILDADSGAELVDVDGLDLKIEHVAPALDGAYVIGGGWDRFVVLHPDTFATLYTWVPLDGGGELWMGPSGFYDGSVSAGRAAHVVLDEGSVPLESYASVLLDPKRARAALLGIDVPSPILPAPPALTVEEPLARFTEVESDEFRVVATARHDGPLLGFQVELDGEVLELDELLAFVEFEDERRVAKLSMPMPKPAQASSVALRICAVSNDGVLSRPVHHTFTFGE